MAFSTQRKTSDGTLVLLDISIEYFDRSEIAVFFDGVLSTPWSWVGSNEKKISFSPAVPNGVEVMVVRSTDLSELRHMFSAGAAFTTQSLDEALLQILHIAQEARENATIEEVFHNLNMHGYRIVNVGPGVADTDAANMLQMNAAVSAAEGFADDAEASAIAAASINQASFATAAQGVKADSALQPSDTGTEANKIVKLDGSARLPAVSGELLTNLPAATQAGMFAYFFASSAPAGWLKANGAAISRTTYAALFAVIGTTFGAGDGSTTFNIPDLRGEFLRGWDDGRGIDSGRGFGSSQTDGIKSHTHTYTLAYNVLTNVPVGSPNAAIVGFTPGTATGATGGTETRPRNIALLACIKY